MSKRIKKGDEVIVIAGNARGQKGRVLQAHPGTDRVLVEGLNMLKHHIKQKSPDGSQKNPDGGIIEREAPIHISNVMLAERWENRRAAEKSSKKAK